jgi:hypothetical protein
MGKFKDRTGKTRVGTVLSGIGGFFSGIFGKKKTANNTATVDTTKVPTTTPKLATQPINGSVATGSGFDWNGLLLTLGTAGLGWFGSQLPDPNTTGLSDAERQALLEQNQQESKNTGSGIIWAIVGGVLIIVGIIFFRKK